MNVIIPDDVLIKMSKANSIEVLLEGNKYSIDAYMKKDHYAQIRIIAEMTNIRISNSN